MNAGEMDTVADWQSQWSSGQWEAFGTMVTAAVAVAAAIFAGWQLREARTLRLEQSKPFVIVKFEPSTVWGNAINLVVENIGSTVARNVKIDFTQNLRVPVEPMTSTSRNCCGMAFT